MTAESGNHPHHQSPIHIGCCAWAFEDWRGPFYPAEVPPARWLAWYARFFNAVEIDSTFYASPSPQTVGHWLAEASPHFRFACKAPSTITHELRLRGCEGPLDDFLGAIESLHAHLGPILLQLPPSFAPDSDAAALRDFVLALPHGWKFAVEFRDPDWHQPRFARLLEDHGICWVWSDRTSLADQDQAPFGFLPETADFLYVRLMGDPRTKYNADGERVFHYKERLWSRAAAMESWAVRLHKQAEHVKSIYTFVNNHYEGFAPVTCRELGARLGLDIDLPSTALPEAGLEGPRQMTLL